MRMLAAALPATLALCSATGCAPEPAARAQVELTYRLAGRARDGDLERTVSYLRELDGVASVRVLDDDGVVIGLPTRDPEAVASFRRLLDARGGSLEFRVVAAESISREILQQHEALGRLFEIDDVNRGLDYPQPWYRIVEPDPERVAASRRPPSLGPEPVVVLLPEAPYEARLEELRAAEKPPEASIHETELELERVRRESVFTHRDVSTARVQRGYGETVVHFRLSPERKDDFSAFTERNVGERLAIVVNGHLNSAPVIRSVLPGEGIIEGGSAGGFSEDEARRLVETLSSGELPTPLVFVEERVTED